MRQDGRMRNELKGRRRMISGLYSAATGMDAATRRHETAAENLANVQMPGFRRRIVTQTTFESMMPSPPAAGSNVSRLLGTETKPTSYDFSQGHLEDTGRPLDMALTGERLHGQWSGRATVFSATVRFTWIQKCARHYGPTAGDGNRRSDCPASERQYRSS